MIAKQARLGNITRSSLNNSISRFKKKVKDFEKKIGVVVKNNIYEQFKTEKADVAEDEIPNSSREYAQMKRDEENGGDGDKSIKTWGAKDIQLLKLKADMVKGRKVYGTDEMSQTVSRALRVLTPIFLLM